MTNHIHILGKERRNRGNIQENRSNQKPEDKVKDTQNVVNY